MMSILTAKVLMQRQGSNIMAITMVTEDAILVPISQPKIIEQT